MKSQKVRNLMFDLGNVIFDLDIEKTRQSFEKMFRKDADKKILDKVFIDYECGRVSSDIFINTLLSQSNRNIQAVDIIDAWNSMLIGIPEYRLDMLLKLRERFNVFLLSNTNEIHLEWVRRHVQKVHRVRDFEERYFDKAFYSHLVGDRKPLPSIFKHVIDEVFMTPALTLYMDDLQENIDTAKKLGFHTYLVKEGEEIAEYLKVEGYY